MSENEDHERPIAVIVDVDNTVTTYDPTLRGVYEHEKADADPENAPICELVRLLDACGFPLVFISGRFERYRAVTEAWLTAHRLSIAELHMRKDGDYRGDDVVKEEIYRRAVEPYWRVWFVLDDRNRVVEMWRDRLGLTCLHVRDGNF